ncbi:hypothetical protein QBC32DRAFT_334133 [Pseudoneurospora amorphoporcata]|uniref:Uncharacterized protein n=1 Tax=Pseudoneurospora amorphoporcata TaxID=241081 RepID=A0AAN6P075_9PEZI|nr:hypothetical protein QBC32DRAFT_334133 [Pseudoneurospora amorphoporcata]
MFLFPGRIGEAREMASNVGWVFVTLVGAVGEWLHFLVVLVFSSGYSMSVCLSMLLSLLHFVLLTLF